MKKGQNQLIFIYIFAIVVIGLIVIFGYRAIKNFKDLGDEGQIVLFIDGIKNKVNDVYSLDKGSSIKLDDIILPSKVREICFVDVDMPLNDIIDDELIDQVVRDSLDSGSQNNLFFVPQRGQSLSKVRFFVEHIKPIENPLCVTDMRITLENKGDYVSVSR
ncbi:MAG TPA: hypothetical protein VJJ23_06735 [Candidatus Nanoarchaeia archaeon]|nr:hypothetical protein [Candidatus Nanoarchaeia archaeon]